MKLLLISLMFSVKIVTSQDEVTETIEDNIVVEEGGSGDIEDVCDDEEGSGEAEAATLLESADYTMSGVSGLTINIGLEWYTDSSVKINCDMEDLTAGDEEDGSGDSSFRASLSSFPSKLFLIKDLGVCNDLGTAVGNDITADALELASVSGPGSASETLSSVTWAEVKESHCMAMLKQNQEASEDDDDGEVVVDRAVAGARQCRRRFSILTPSVASARIFAPINLAAFSLVSVGVTSAFAISAGIPAVVAAQSSNIDNNNFWDAESVYTAAPFIALAGIYWLTGYPLNFFLARRRRNDNFRRKSSNPREKISYLERMEEIQIGVGNFVDTFEDLGNAYIRSLQDGPLGRIFSLGSGVVNLFRRWDDLGKRRRRDKKKRRKYYNYVE